MTSLSATIPVESALRRGIKAVGIGKKGSRCLPKELAVEILAELQKGEFTPASRAAFFAALFIKGVSEEEHILSDHFTAGTLQDADKLSQALCQNAPPLIKTICTQLLEQKELTSADAYILGKFLLSNESGDGARGLAAIALRVRYETIEEYLSLLKNLNETIHPNFRGSVPNGAPIVQLAEPFDGVDHNYMITPCVADFLQKQNLRVITLIGRNSGPKLVNNLYDLAKKLDLSFLKNNDLLTSQQPAGGFYVDQKDLSPALDRWVDLRHQIIKRPFLATLEKFLDPCAADIIVTSAFHGVYGDKMAAVAQGAGFPGSIVVRNGVEGTIAFPLTRPAKLLCSARQNDGTYLNQEIVFDAVEFLKSELPIEEKLDDPSLEINAQLVDEFLKHGQTKNIEFNRRIAVTCAGIQKGIDWIMEHTYERRKK
jgi:anthranilate phosphoribosyltransferase